MKFYKCIVQVFLMPFLAHFGTGFAAKRFAPKISIWILLISSMLIDIISLFFPTATWASHGLLMALIWTILASLISFTTVKFMQSSKRKHGVDENEIMKLNAFHSSMMIGLLVFGHWILDFIGWPLSVWLSNAEGVPFFFTNTPNYGLGLYSTWAGALITDIGVLIIGIIVYINFRKNQARKLDQ